MQPHLVYGILLLTLVYCFLTECCVRTALCVSQNITMVRALSIKSSVYTHGGTHHAVPFEHKNEIKRGHNLGPTNGVTSSLGEGHTVIELASLCCDPVKKGTHSVETQENKSMYSICAST